MFFNVLMRLAPKIAVAAIGVNGLLGQGCVQAPQETQAEEAQAGTSGICPADSPPPAKTPPDPCNVRNLPLLDCPVPIMASGNLSFAAVKNYITQNQAAIPNTDTLIACLPDELFLQGGYAAMFDSFATEGIFVTAECPRTILFNGGFVLSFTGSPDTEDYEIVRSWEFNSATKRFDFNEIDFSKNKTATFREKPEECSSCHAVSGSNDPKPIWHAYRDWEGAFGQYSDGDFGENDGSAYNDMDQYEKFLSFMDAGVSTPRYHRFITQAVNDNPDPANSTLLNNSLRFNGERLLRKFQESEHYEHLKYWVAFSLLQCNPDETIDAFFQETFGPLYSEDCFYQMYLANKDAGDQDTGSQNIRGIAMLITLSHYMGFTGEDWDFILNLNKTNQEMDFRYQGPGFRTEHDPRSHFWTAFRGALSTDPQAASFTDLRDWDGYEESVISVQRRSEYVNLFDRDISIHFTEECNALQPLVHQSIEQK